MKANPEVSIRSNNADNPKYAPTNIINPTTALRSLERQSMFSF